MLHAVSEESSLHIAEKNNIHLFLHFRERTNQGCTQRQSLGFFSRQKCNLWFAGDMHFNIAKYCTKECTAISIFRLIMVAKKALKKACVSLYNHEGVLSPVYSDTTQLNSTQLPVVDPPTARRRFWTSWASWSSLWVMTSCMMQNSHEIREFVLLYDRLDIMESWTEELENKLIEL